MSLIHKIRELSCLAGVAILDVYEREFSVVSKQDQSPLTEADLLANQIILDGLREISPDIPVLSEESVSEFYGPNEKGLYWLVDPLDGTKEFINKSGDFTVNIALISKGKPVLSVVYVPVKDVLYFAELNQGAYKLQNGEYSKIQVSPRKTDQPWRIVGSRSHGSDMHQCLSQLGPYELISVGSSLKFCMVAEGLADLYPRFGPTSLWDTAAAQLVLEEAGGMLIDLNGKVLDYHNPGLVLNPYFLALGSVDIANLLKRPFNHPCS